MAVNEKTVYAKDHTTFGGLYFRPGEPMSDRGVPEYAIRSAQESGLATTSQAEADRAKGAEQARRAEVARQIADRSEKRDFQPREDRRR